MKYHYCLRHVVLLFGVLIILLFLLENRWRESLHVSIPSPGSRANINENNTEQNKSSNAKLILFWTSFYDGHEWMPPSFADLKCKVNSCDVTFNQSFLDKSDAVVLHWHNVNLNDFPRKHSNKRYILLNFECPRRTDLIKLEFLPKLQPLIDWTATYRLDSDVLATYGSVERRAEKDAPQTHYGTETEFKNKRLAAWMVGNCGASSGRRNIVNELKSYGVEIDEYGSCPSGNKSLRNLGLPEAHRFLANRYKFYLSFENNLCRDYASEKLYQALHKGMVPVVYGGSNYQKLLPGNSYIDVLDFESIEDLARYLMVLGNTEKLYNKHQKWRNDYDAFVNQLDVTNFLCELCGKIQNPNSVIMKRNTDLVKWWNAENDCVNAVFDGEKFSPSKTRARRDALYSDAVF